MTETKIEEVPPSTDELNTVHVVCESNEDVALCGEPVKGNIWQHNPPPEEECVVCLELEKTHECEACK